MMFWILFVNVLAATPVNNGELPGNVAQKRASTGESIGGSRDSVPTLPVEQIRTIQSNIDPEGILWQYVPRLASRGCLAKPAVDIEGYSPHERLNLGESLRGLILPRHYLQDHLLNATGFLIRSIPELFEKA